MALCGLGSRRACERLIDQGRVSVDGCVVRRQGACIDPACQNVTYDGRRLFPERKVYLLLNKPRGILCTSNDPQGRPVFKSLLPILRERVYNVGRLDRDSEGLLIVTNDGDLALSLMHPRYEIEKTYQVWIGKKLTAAEMRRFTAGIFCRGEMLKVERLIFRGADKNSYQYEIRLKEGRKRHIRRMFEVLMIRVARLKRTSIGPLVLGDLRAGAWRRLNVAEVRMLKKLVPERKVLTACAGVGQGINA